MMNNPSIEIYRDVTLIIVPDDFVARIADEPIETLHHVLKAAGLFNREPRAHDKKQQHKQEGNQDLHRHVIGNGLFGCWTGIPKVCSNAVTGAAKSRF